MTSDVVEFNYRFIDFLQRGQIARVPAHPDIRRTFSTQVGLAGRTLGALAYSICKGGPISRCGSIWSRALVCTLCELTRRQEKHKNVVVTLRYPTVWFLMKSRFRATVDKLR